MKDNNGWFPKETAPKDGSWFLAYVPGSGMGWEPYELAAWQVVDCTTIENGRVRHYQECYFGEQDTSDEIEFDWWQPLPAPPTL